MTRGASTHPRVQLTQGEDRCDLPSLGQCPPDLADAEGRGAGCEAGAWVRGQLDLENMQREQSISVKKIADSIHILSESMFEGTLYVFMFG